MAQKIAQKIDNRLGLYVAAAGAAAVGGAANAQIVAATDLDISIDIGESVLLDFGPGLGEAFQFEMFRDSFFAGSTLRGSTTGTYGSSSYFVSSGALFQFNPGQTLWSAASFMNNAGGYSFGNDPARLAFGAPIGFSQTWEGPMSSSFSTLHDIAIRSYGLSTAEGSYFFSSSYGAWIDDERGYIGFRLDAADEARGADYLYGWIDVGISDNLGTLTIYGWGINTTPNAGLFAGEVPAPGAGGLAMLAMGAAGIRRKRRTG